jgi:hypothetical protein
MPKAPEIGLIAGRLDAADEETAITDWDVSFEKVCVGKRASV